MQLILVLIVYAIIVTLLFFWQVSNIISVLIGAPAISSPHNEAWQQFADKDKTILDLGCGNGSMCLRMAPHFKHVYGIEYSPFYYLVAKWRSRGKNITIRYGNIFTMTWPETDYIYCYLLPELLKKLRSSLAKTEATILCLAFPIPGLKSGKTVKEQGRVLYVYRPSDLV